MVPHPAEGITSDNLHLSLVINPVSTTPMQPPDVLRHVTRAGPVFLAIALLALVSMPMVYDCAVTAHR